MGLTSLKISQLPGVKQNDPGDFTQGHSNVIIVLSWLPGFVR